MLRLLGCIMITTGCLGLGYWYRQQFALRLHHLRYMGNILEMMMSEIRYSKSTLPECCGNLTQRLEEPYRKAFSDIYEFMKHNTGEEFGQVFHRTMEECLKEIPIKKEEKELFLKFTSVSGFEDGKMQIRSMEQYNDRLKNIVQKLEQEISEKSRMALGLGAMSGLLLVIILL